MQEDLPILKEPHLAHLRFVRTGIFGIRNFPNMASTAIPIRKKVMILNSISEPEP